MAKKNKVDESIITDTPIYKGDNKTFIEEWSTPTGNVYKDYINESLSYKNTNNVNNTNKPIPLSGMSQSIYQSINEGKTQTPYDRTMTDIKKLFKNMPHNGGKYLKDKKKGTISRFFSNMSNMNLDYGSDVLSNMRAVPANTAIMSDKDKMSLADIYNTMDSKWLPKQNAERDFHEKDLPTKREMLRKLSLQPELEDILDTMANEAIVYDQDEAYFIKTFVDEIILSDVKSELREKMSESLSTNFPRLYRALNWKRNGWDDFKRFLIDGILSYEIVYDRLDKPTKIIGIVPLDPVTLTRTYEGGKIYWIQYKGVKGRERKLLDAQVVYVQYQENVAVRQSYTERLVRPYNIYRIIEQAQIIWTITNASFRTKYTIPLKGMNKTNGAQALRQAMHSYKEDIQFTSDTGELKVNGQPNIPFNKDIWMPETDSGTPDAEVIGGDGPDLNDNDQLRFFKNELYKISKIPLSRFDKEGGETFFGSDPTSVARDEMNFARFVSKLRNSFSQVILKPLQIQLALDVPELQADINILDAVQIQYHSYNVFQEMWEQELMQKRVEFIQEMKDSLIDMDTEGNEVKYFSSGYLVARYLKLSDEEIKMNEKYKKIEMEALQVETDDE